MTDNVLANAGSGGATFATDADDSGSPSVHYPITKLAFGALNTFTLVTASTGLPIGDAGGSLTVDNGGTFAVQAAQSGAYNITNISGTVSLPTGASTAAKQPALGTAGTASTDVLTIQGIASMTKLLVTPDANSSVNVAQLAGTTTDTNSGSKSAGTLRVVLATDQPALTNKLLVTPDSVALPANQSVNVSQINAVTVLMGNGVTGTGSQRVTIASDNTAFQTKPTPQTSGGLSFKKVLSANNTTSVAVKASAGQLYAIYATNTNASPRFLKIYNVAQGSTSVGTTTPDLTFLIPGNTAGGGFVFDTGGLGIAFSTAITYGITTAVADNDTGAPAANEVVATILYA